MSSESSALRTDLPLTPENNPFGQKGHWYKGNLHVHTTNSDGEYSPQATVDFYAKAGYDFLAISDHSRLTDPDDVDGRGMVLLPAVEFGGGRAELGQSYHILAVGLHGSVRPLDAGTSQEAVEQVRSQAEIVVIAHAYWSSLTADDLMAVEGYDGMEVYNTTCERGIGRGHSEPQWDDLLARGRMVFGIAVDDAHFHYFDALGGWIHVKAAQLDRRHILDAIKSGHFYASSGPEIKDISFGDGAVYVECSPAVSVALVVAAPGKGWTTDRLRTGNERATMTEAELPLGAASDRVFRIEVTDEQGRRAWSNPYCLA
jgi:predicted metal-dependent phosphoesterase TrpH